MFTCQDLAAAIERLQPEAQPRDVARLCLLLSNTNIDLDTLANEEKLIDAWTQTEFRLQASSDQHAAMTAELEELANASPESLNSDQIWVLLRAIKVQSQVLQLYLGEPIEV